MKTVILAFALMAGFTIGGASTAEAQTKKTTTAQTLLSTLGQTSIQNGLINVGNVSVDVSQVTVQDLVTVQSVLNNADIDVLNNSINNNEVLKNITVNLTNLLRDAKILNQNQVIVGVLSDQSDLQFVTMNRRAMSP